MERIIGGTRCEQFHILNACILFQRHGIVSRDANDQPADEMKVGAAGGLVEYALTRLAIRILDRQNEEGTVLERKAIPKIGASSRACRSANT